MENFKVMLPGLWIMALSPLMMVLYPTVVGLCMWQVVLTKRGSLCSPRVVLWTSNLVPAGKEGLLFAFVMMRALLGLFADYSLGALNGM